MSKNYTKVGQYHLEKGSLLVCFLKKNREVLKMDQNQYVQFLEYIVSVINNRNKQLQGILQEKK